MEEEENFLTLVDQGPIKHILFHGPINKLNAANLITNLIGIDGDFKKVRKEAGFGFTDEQVRDEDLQDCGKIILHISSSGGSINSAFAIADTIKNLETPVDCIIDAQAVSAAVIVFLSCRKRAMQDHASIFIHDTLHSCDSLCFNEMADFVKEQAKIYDKVIDYYIEKTEMNQNQIKSFFKSTKNFSSTEAQKLGFTNATVKEVNN